LFPKKKSKLMVYAIRPRPLLKPNFRGKPRPTIQRGRRTIFAKTGPTSRLKPLGLKPLLKPSTAKANGSPPSKASRHLIWKKIWNGRFVMQDLPPSRTNPWSHGISLTCFQAKLKRDWLRHWGLHPHQHLQSFNGPNARNGRFLG